MPARVTSPLPLTELANSRASGFPISLGSCETEDIDAGELIEEFLKQGEYLPTTQQRALTNTKIYFFYHLHLTVIL
jgi:hypothetical protein